MSSIAKENTILEVDPHRCRMWELHDRLEEHLPHSTSATQIERFDRRGQLAPVLGRSLNGDPTYDVELVFGARRLFIARQLNEPLQVMIREMSDREAVVAMDAENRERLDISPYERGLCYARLIRDGYFDSQEELARVLGVSASQVSRLIKITRLPAVIVAAFESPAHICERWGLHLAEACQSQERRTRMAVVARQLAAMPLRPCAHDIYRRLMASSNAGQSARSKPHDRVITDPRGSPLFRARWLQHSMVLELSFSHVRSLAGAQQITEAVSGVLTELRK